MIRTYDIDDFIGKVSDILNIWDVIDNMCNVAKTKADPYVIGGGVGTTAWDVTRFPMCYPFCKFIKDGCLKDTCLREEYLKGIPDEMRELLDALKNEPSRNKLEIWTYRED